MEFLCGEVQYVREMTLIITSRKEHDLGDLHNTWLASMGSGDMCGMVRACRSIHCNIGYMRYIKCLGLGCPLSSWCLGHMDAPSGGSELGPHLWTAWNDQAGVWGPS